MTPAVFGENFYNFRLRSLGSIVLLVWHKIENSSAYNFIVPNLRSDSNIWCQLSAEAVGKYDNWIKSIFIPLLFFSDSLGGGCEGVLIRGVCLPGTGQCGCRGQYPVRIADSCVNGEHKDISVQIMGDNVYCCNLILCQCQWSGVSVVSVGGAI